MATVRQRILQLKSLGYSAEECWREVKYVSKDVTKTYVNQVLAKNAGESNHQRRTELIYEMNLEILSLLRLFLHGFTPRTIAKAKERLELNHQHKVASPLPEEPGTRP